MNSAPSGPVTLSRDVTATQIPAGLSVTLAKGLQVEITQSLGGSYTVATSRGLFRIVGGDADALGLEPESIPAAAASGDLSEELVWEVLKTCYDPEIPVNIVDLGLVYDLVISEAEGGKRVDVKMTLTAPGCGMGGAISADAQQKIMQLRGVKEADVAVVWEPQWNPSMISPAGKEKLGMA
jgi:probable FeS assembly SUF system protein SufT